MSFDGILLSKIKDEIKYLETGRISKITENGDTDFILTIRSNRENHNLILSFSSEYSRIHLTKRLYDSVLNPKSFTMFLRKHIEGYFIESINQYSTDRIIYFTLKGYNEMQDLNTKYLICEIMGRYSNLILADQDFIIIDALKHDGVGEYNRTILPNAKYEFPKTEKLNPYDYDKDQINDLVKNAKNPKDILNIFNGISLTLATPLFYNDKIGDNLYNSIHSDIKPSIIINERNKQDFYYIPLNYEIVKSFDTISEMLDSYFYSQDLKSKVKQKTGDLITFVNRQIKKYENKLEKLERELIENESSDYLKLYGELLLSLPNLKAKEKNVTVLNYYNNEYVNIPLDNKLTIIDNSNKYFKRYQKSKTSVQYINEQMEITKNEIEYFKVLKYQLDDASINEAIEIQDELINGKYLFNKVTQNKKKNQKPKLLTYIVGDTLISVGKNNIQNEYLTHKFAKAGDTWFHVKGAPGSHVVVHKADELTEDEIRTAAGLAAYYSTYKDSSSVAVDYTKIKFIKKIPGRRACFVTYTHQNTIYIDPSEEMVLGLTIKK